MHTEHTRPSRRAPWRAPLAVALTAALALSGIGAANAYTFQGNTVVEVGDEPSALAVSPDGSRVYVANKASDTVSVVSTASASVIATIPVCDGPQQLVISPTGARLFVACGPNLTVVDTALNAATQSLLVFSTNSVSGVVIADMTVAPDGSTLYAYSEEGVVKAISLATPILFVPTTPLADLDLWNAKGIAISPDGASLYLTDYGNGTLTKLSTATGERLYVVKLATWLSHVVVSPDGATLYVGTNGVLRVSSATGTLLTTTTGISGTEFVRSPDGSRLYSVQGFTSAVVTFWDAATMTSLMEIRPSVASGSAAGFTDLAVAPDGGTVYIASSYQDALIMASTAVPPAAGSDAPVGSVATATTTSAKLSKKTSKLTIRTSVATGKAVIRVGKKKVAAVKVKNGKATYLFTKKRTKKLAKGTYKVRVTFTPASNAYAASVSKPVKLTVKR